MRNIGDFFDLVHAWTEKNSELEAESFLDEWKDGVSEAIWQKIRLQELTELFLLAFAEDMATKFRERINGISTEEGFKMTHKSGHAFLKAIAEIGRTLGVSGITEKVDVPLSWSDAIQAEGDVTIGEAVASLNRKGYFARPRPWKLAFRDRGLGRGDFAVLDRFDNLVAEVPERADAVMIIEAVNAYKP